MRPVFILLALLIIVGHAQATYINDQAFKLNNGAYITVNTTTIDDDNQLVCCDYGLMLVINGSTTNYTAGVNKTISSATFNNATDNFTVQVSGVAGYINISATMMTANTAYSLTANGVSVESRSTNTDKVVWFNYTGDAALSVAALVPAQNPVGNSGNSYTVTPKPTPDNSTEYYKEYPGTFQESAENVIKQLLEPDAFPATAAITALIGVIVLVWIWLRRAGRKPKMKTWVWKK